MLKFIICEDNKEEADLAALMINKAMAPYDFEYRIKKFALYTKELKDIIEDNNDQKVYILDVELGKVSGLEIASKIREKDWDSFIIFTTINREAKNDVFYSRLLVIDFILKNSFYEKRLKETIDQVLNIINKKRVLIYTYKSSVYRIPFETILYIEKIPIVKKCTIVTESGNKFDYPGTVTEIGEKLGPNFIQTHQSGIINIDKIKSVDFNGNTITLINNEKIGLLANSHKKELKEIVGDYY